MAIEKLKSLDVARLSNGRHSDGGGLYLQVRGKARSWLFRYQLHGREHFMGLGSAEAISLKRARELAAEARASAAEKVDPLQERRLERNAALVAEAKLVTFKECAEGYIRDHEGTWKNAKHRYQWRATLEQFVYPHIGALPVQDIDTALVLRCIKPLWQDKTETASRTRGRIERILDWATVHGHRTGDNPARWRGHISEALPQPEKINGVEHHPALPYAEIGTFMVDLRRRDSTTAKALEFLILTAARTGEVIGATWSEIDLASKVWTIPADRMKGGREHRVPLSDRAVAILREMQSRCQSDYAFPGQRNAGLSNASLSAMLKIMHRADLTVHGFRSTFRDWASECTNFPNEVCEAALAHVVSDKTEAAYRRGDLFEKRRRLMAAWAEYCGKSAQPAGSVTPMRGRA
jgi:integrase